MRGTCFGSYTNSRRRSCGPAASRRRHPATRWLLRITVKIRIIFKRIECFHFQRVSKGEVDTEPTPTTAVHDHTRQSPQKIVINKETRSLSNSSMNRSTFSG